jgi:hypothetical protein
MKTQKPILSFSDSDCYDSEKESILETLKEEGCFPEDIEAECEKRLSSADYSFYWDSFKEALTELMQEKNKEGFWSAEGKNLNWRGVGGEKVFKATTTEELIRNVFPKTNDFSVEVFHNKKSGLFLRVSHHDCPTGSLFYLSKISEKEFNKAEGGF